MREVDKDHHHKPKKVTVKQRQTLKTAALAVVESHNVIALQPILEQLADVKQRAAPTGFSEQLSSCVEQLQREPPGHFAFVARMNPTIVANHAMAEHGPPQEMHLGVVVFVNIVEVPRMDYSKY